MENKKIKASTLPIIGTVLAGILFLISIFTLIAVLSDSDNVYNLHTMQWIMLIITPVSSIIIILLYTLGFVKETPKYVLAGALIATASFITSPLFMIPIAVLGYIGQAKQRKINNKI